MQGVSVSFAGKYRSAGRHQTVRRQTSDIHTLFPNARGFRRLGRPGSRRRRGFAPGCLRFRPQSGPVQRGGKRFLRLTGLSPRGFLGLTAALPLRGVVAAGAVSIYAACRQRWWTPLKMKGAMMIKLGSRPAGEARLYGFPFRGAEL